MATKTCPNCAYLYNLDQDHIQCRRRAPRLKENQNHPYPWAFIKKNLVNGGFCSEFVEAGAELAKCSTCLFFLPDQGGKGWCQYWAPEYEQNQNQDRYPFPTVLDGATGFCGNHSDSDGNNGHNGITNPQEGDQGYACPDCDYFEPSQNQCRRHAPRLKENQNHDWPWATIKASALDNAFCSEYKAKRQAPRTEHCDGCEWYLDSDSQVSDGLCMHHAPEYEQNQNQDRFPWPTLLDRQTGWCGDFDPDTD